MKGLSIRLAAATVLAFSATFPCAADDAQPPTPSREDQLFDRLDLAKFEELADGLGRQSLSDPAAVHASARALVRRDWKRARRWAASELTAYLEAPKDRKDSAVRALVIELYSATVEDRELLLKCAKDADHDVADLSRVALAAVKEPSDLTYFLDSLAAVTPASRWSAAVGVIALGDASTWERLKEITAGPGWRDDDPDRKGPPADLIVRAAYSRLYDAMRCRREAERDAARRASGSKVDATKERLTVHWVIEMKLEGELGKQDLDRERDLIAWTWSQDRPAVVAAVSTALAPQASSGKYDHVRAVNAMEMIETAASADDLDAALRRLRSDATAPEDLRSRALWPLASHGVPDSTENRRLLAAAILSEPHNVAWSVASDVATRGDAKMATELRSAIGHRGTGSQGLTDEELGRVALALTALSRRR